MTANQREAVTAYVAIGANLGDAVTALQSAVQALKSLPLTQVKQCSSLYKTAPLDTDSDASIAPPTCLSGSTGSINATTSNDLGDDYFNAVVELQTSLNAPDLLDALQLIETNAGRERPYRNAPRTLDLDLLLYGSASINSPRLTVPHPRMHQRAFVLIPLAEISKKSVSTADLEAVKNQQIERFPSVSLRH